MQKNGSDMMQSLTWLNKKKKKGKYDKNGQKVDYDCI